jgi:ABC-type sugar transport system substrate-binding protein
VTPLEIKARRRRAAGAALVAFMSGIAAAPGLAQAEPGSSDPKLAREVYRELVEILGERDHLARFARLEQMLECSSIRGAQRRICRREAARDGLAPSRPEAPTSKVVVRQRLEDDDQVEIGVGGAFSANERAGYNNAEQSAYRCARIAIAVAIISSFTMVNRRPV